ncbi:MAG: GNAT family N-acetyltransferase, partial [Bacteroidota bacterium]|nr:GNAT family N-acetyltransferase [Bacteroidota bacterium]
MIGKALIRTYTQGDKDKVVSLLRMNTPKSFSLIEEKDLIYYLENEIEHYFVIEFDSRIVGCGGFNFSGDVNNGKISWDIL